MQTRTRPPLSELIVPVLLVLLLWALSLFSNWAVAAECANGIDAATGALESAGTLLDAATDLLPKIGYACALLAAVVPKASGGWLGKLRCALDLVACNWGYAKNATKENRPT